MRATRWPAVLGLAGATLAGAAAAMPGAGAAAAGEPQVVAPAATLLYQNFPNPFPTSASPTTCIWFDLAAPGPVSLAVYDLRGNRVRRLFPAAGESARLEAGRYGRGAGGAGCDGRFTWDGTGEDGGRVPSGVYLLRLRAGGERHVRKMLFSGG